MTQNNETAQPDMLGMEYADPQQCFIIAGNEVRPVLPLLVSSDGLEGVAHDNVIAALDAALARGCDINQPDLSGLSPLNTAILQGNIELADYLLEHGANPTQTISSSEPAVNGLDSAGLIDLLEERAPAEKETWQKLRELLR